MSWKQLHDADMKVGYVGGWCLKYVQDAFKTPHLYPTAIAAWKAETAKHTDKPPLGITVPVYLSLGHEPAGHVAIRLDDGMVASSTQAGTHSRPYIHKSLDDLIAVYAKYNGGAKYLGWGEHVGGVQVVQNIVNATAAQVKQLYLQILERPADASGLAHYQHYPVGVVKASLLSSPEYKALQEKKKAKSIAEAAHKAALEAKAKADAEAAAKAKADAEARQKALEKQPEPQAVPPIPEVQDTVVKQSSVFKIVIDFILSIIKILRKG